MIDLHSHILPGIDDGAQSIEESLALAKQSVAVGVTHMCCTPHLNYPVFANDHHTIVKTFTQFMNATRDAGISLKMSMAAEVRLTPEIIEWEKQKTLPFIGKYRNKRALLLELPHSHVPAGTDTLVKWLLQHDIQAVIPHPERNREILANYKKVLWLKSIGCIFQLTAGSLHNRFKANVRDIAWQMLEDNLIAYIASDLHSINKRPNDMGKAFIAVEKTFGTNKAEGLFIRMPRAISEQNKWH